MALLSYLHFAVVQIAVSVLGAIANRIEAIHGNATVFFFNICLIVWLFLGVILG